MVSALQLSKTGKEMSLTGPAQAILDRDGTEIFWAVPPKFRDGTASNLVLMGRNLGTARAVPAVPLAPGLLGKAGKGNAFTYLSVRHQF